MFVQPWTDVQTDRAWKPEGTVRIEIDQETSEPHPVPDPSRSDGKKDAWHCKCCCRLPTFVVFIVLLVIVLAVIARAYAIYEREVATAADEGGGDIVQQFGTPGGNPGQYTRRSDDASHVCGVTPQLTCTCDGTPLIQVRTDGETAQVFGQHCT